MLSILVLGAFIPLTNGACAESSTAPHSTHLLKHALKISPPSKFSVTYVGSRSTQSPTPSQPDAYECLSQLLENIYDEQSHISELKALLTTCPDKTSHEARNLCHKIMESLRIVDTYNDYLVSLMYPNRFKESLQQEAQQNCLWYVKLVLHQGGYFHIPRLVKTNPMQDTD